MSIRSSVLALALVLVPSLAVAQSASRAPAAPSATSSFGLSAPEALNAMRARAQELKVTGVALVAYMPGDSLQSWTSSILVVGRYKDPATDSAKGSNLLAVVYAKAAEMADTLKDSGSNVRPPMTGEFGWQGGVIARSSSGYLIAAFSGGKSEDDVQVARAGLAVLQRHP